MKEWFRKVFINMEIDLKLTWVDVFSKQHSISNSWWCVKLPRVLREYVLACSYTWRCNLQVDKDGKSSVFIPIPKKGNAKECSNYRTIALISHTSKVMLKILQARLQQYMNYKLPDIQAGFRKGRGTILPTSTGSSKKQESSR